MTPLDLVPAIQRDAVHTALTAAFGPAPITTASRVIGGASGAILLRVEVGARDYLLKIEGPETPLLRRNPHRFAAGRRATEAGVAPALHYQDEANGIEVMDFIPSRPLNTFPGGPPALAVALGVLVRRLQRHADFPPLIHYPDLVTDMLGRVRDAGIFADGLLDPHFERLAGLRAANVWEPAALVASHNDPNPGNILFDGERLWLIDWEAGYANHPIVDVAILLDTLAREPDLEIALLIAWLGRAPDGETQAELANVRPLTRLYYACFLLNAGHMPGSLPDPDLALQNGLPENLHNLGKAYLNAFLTGAAAPTLPI
jgi:hypothetical protein